jgi:hypothetical protein
MSAPTFVSLKFLLLATILLLGCEEKEPWIEDPARYLETTSLPGYFQRISYFGANGHNGLKPPEKESHCSAYGVYATSRSRCFIRTFSDSVLFHIPLQESLPYASEVIGVQVSGTAVQNGEPLLSKVKVVFTVEFASLYEKVIKEYPKLMDKIAPAVHHPKSKLDLKSIETFHCAASGDKLLIFGRTYDLMYEFDLGFLFEKEGESFKIKRIFAHHFFKGE